MCRDMQQDPLTHRKPPAHNASQAGSLRPAKAIQLQFLLSNRARSYVPMCFALHGCYVSWFM